MYYTRLDTCNEFFINNVFFCFFVVVVVVVVFFRKFSKEASLETIRPGKSLHCRTKRSGRF